MTAQHVEHAGFGKLPIRACRAIRLKVDYIGVLGTHGITPGDAKKDREAPADPMPLRHESLRKRQRLRRGLAPGDTVGGPDEPRQIQLFERCLYHASPPGTHFELLTSGQSLSPNGRANMALIGLSHIFAMTDAVSSVSAVFTALR